MSGQTQPRATCVTRGAYAEREHSTCLTPTRRAVTQGLEASCLSARQYFFPGPCRSKGAAVFSVCVTMTN